MSANKSVKALMISIYNTMEKMNFDDLVDLSYESDLKSIINSIKTDRRNALLNIFNDLDIDDPQKIADEITKHMNTERIIINDLVDVAEVAKKLTHVQEEQLKKYIHELDPVDYQKVSDDVTKALGMSRVLIERATPKTNLSWFHRLTACLRKSA
jgi:hypothetical protein